MEETVDLVENLLETYREREQKIKVLRYQRDHPVKISEIEQIEMMVYGHGDGLGGIKGNISDKTHYAAINYKKQAERTNLEMINAIMEELSMLEQCQNQLNYYISLLDKRQADIIRLVYVERVSKTDIAKQYERAGRTIDRIRKEAIRKLVEFYEYSKAFEK